MIQTEMETQKKRPLKKYTRLDDLKIKNFKPDKDRDYKKADEKGLYLLIKKTGSKLWQLQYRDPQLRKQKVLSFGAYPEVSLADARLKRDEARRKVRQGIDPSLERKAFKAAHAEAVANTFELMAREWALKRNKQDDERLNRIFEKHLFPYIGKLPVKEITAQLAWKTIERIEELGLKEEPKRARQYADKIYCYAINTGRVAHNPFASLKEELKKHPTKHHAAITEPKALGELMRAIYGYQGAPSIRAGLKLAALFFCRPGELRQMEWSEVNWEKQMIELPESKMKMRKPHIIPLCSQAVDILKDLKLHTGHGKYVFHNARDTKGMTRCMSENSLSAALRTIGYDNKIHSVHGFRATAKTNLEQELGFRSEIVELQLAHKVKDLLGNAYNRTTYLPERMKMMQVWADWLDGLRMELEVNEFKKI